MIGLMIYLALRRLAAIRVIFLDPLLFRLYIPCYFGRTFRFNLSCTTRPDFSVASPEFSWHQHRLFQFPRVFGFGRVYTNGASVSIQMRLSDPGNFFLEFLENSKNHREDEKKTQSKFHRDKTNVSWFKIGGTIFWGPVQGGRRGEFVQFLENQKIHQWGRTKRSTASFIVIR